MSNTITVTGRLPEDPILRFTASGKPCTTVAVPDQKRAKNDAGEWVDQSATTWLRATVWDEDAEALAESAVKGDTVTITGRLITREYTTSNGEVRQSLEIDHPTVTVKPRAKAAARAQQSTATDPWATNGGGDENPF